MTADENLSSTQFPSRYYHGTAVNLPRGAAILPASELQESVSPYAGEGAWRAEKVWMTEDPDDAKGWAENAVETRGAGVPTVFEVEPLGDVGGSLGDWHTPRARVIRRFGEED